MGRQIIPVYLCKGFGQTFRPTKASPPLSVAKSKLLLSGKLRFIGKKAGTVLPKGLAYRPHSARGSAKRKRLVASGFSVSTQL